MSRSVVPILIFMLSAPMHFANAQAIGKVNYEETEAYQYEVSGEALPKYYVITGFLRDGYSIYEKLPNHKASEHTHLSKYLDELGINHLDSGRDITTTALQDAAVELRKQTFDIDLADQPEVFRADQHARLTARAQQIGEIYGQFLALLLDSGMTRAEIATIDERIDAKYRPRYSLLWKLAPGEDEPDRSYLVRSEEFEMAVSHYYDTQNLNGWNALPRMK